MKATADRVLQWIIVGLLAAILVVTAIPVLSPATSAPRWEYMVRGIPDLEFDSSMNTLGNAGWDLVFARRAQDSAGDMLYECILKRAK